MMNSIMTEYDNASVVAKSAKQTQFVISKK
jgi:hypothetical protein